VNIVITGKSATETVPGQNKKRSRSSFLIYFDSLSLNPIIIATQPL